LFATTRIASMDTISKQLESLSTVLLRAVVAEQALAGMAALSANAAFVTKIAGLNSVVAQVVLVFLYLVEFCMVASLCIPSVKDQTTVVSMLYVVLAGACAFEVALASSTHDRCTRTKALFLMLACLKHAVSAACSRRLRMYTGSVGEEDSITDAISFGLRERASRYKLAPTACIVILCVAVYTVFYCEHPFASAPLSRMLGCAQYARSLAIVAFASAVGSEDRSRDRFRKKSL
jgi:hypothetical protein